jgi:hypothetical protein
MYDTAAGVPVQAELLSENVVFRQYNNKIIKIITIIIIIIITIIIIMIFDNYL